jgi:hypothetical protein
MWNLLKKSEQPCMKTLGGLEGVAAQHWSGSNIRELIERLPAAERQHAAACSRCREAAENMVVTHKLFRGVASAAEVGRPFFASRVMAAIAARERELAHLINPWSEVPRFASKLAWITAVVLLAGTTWFYEREVTARHSPSSMAGPESIFEPTAPANQDDVLISMAEAQP